MAEASQQISKEMPQEDCRRDNLPLFQSCKDKSLQTVLSWYLCHDCCLSGTVSFPQCPSSGGSEEQAKFVVRGLACCDVVMVVQALCSG